MTDFDSIWRTQDEIRTVVNAILGECIWNPGQQFIISLFGNSVSASSG